MQVTGRVSPARSQSGRSVRFSIREALQQAGFRRSATAGRQRNECTVGARVCARTTGRSCAFLQCHARDTTSPQPTGRSECAVLRPDLVHCGSRGGPTSRDTGSHLGEPEAAAVSRRWSRPVGPRPGELSGPKTATLAATTANVVSAYPQRRVSGAHEMDATGFYRPCRGSSTRRRARRQSRRRQGWMPVVRIHDAKFRPSLELLCRSWPRAAGGHSRIRPRN